MNTHNICFYGELKKIIPCLHHQILLLHNDTFLCSIILFLSFKDRAWVKYEGLYINFSLHMMMMSSGSMTQQPMRVSLHIYSPLFSLSQSPRDSLKYFQISVPRHIRFAELRKNWTEQPYFTNEYVVVLRFYGPVNPMGSCRARSVYLTTRLLGRLSPPSG